jgi:hypothetical protein
MAAIAIWVAIFVSNRKRRWSDRARLGKASAMPPELVEAEPEKVRNMIPGQAAWVDRSYVLVDKKGRTWVDWTALLSHEAPVSDWTREQKVHLRRLERGFSITVHQKHQFRQRPWLLWGYYAPVIEIVQDVAPQQTETKHT